MYFLVNEGKDDIDTDAVMTVKGTPIKMDLWRGEYYGIDFDDVKNGTRIRLSLKGHESVLILFEMNGGKFDCEPKKTLIQNLKFEQTSQDEESLTKTYRAEYIKTTDTNNEYFEISCEEMAECFVNGEFVGVSFFNHAFNIGRYLNEGKNEITLVITGSIANKYSDSDIYYGLL
jgi:hypothetical protein